MNNLYFDTVKLINANCNNINDLKLIYRTILLNICSYTYFMSINKIYNLLQKCIKCGVNVNLKIYNGGSILHYGCVLGISLDFIKIIINNNANVNMCDNDGNTPMHLLAVFMNNKKIRFQIAKYLMENGADVSILNNKRFAAFDLHNVYDMSKISYIKQIIKIYDNYLKTKKTKKRIYEFAQLACFDTNKSEFSKFFKLECGIRKFFVKRINTYL